MSAGDEKPATLQSEWAGFQRAAVPAQAPDVQRRGMRTSFYAGALVMFKLVNEASAHQSEADCMAAMTALKAELDHYAKQLAIAQIERAMQAPRPPTH
jgi:hypothetical protein